MHPLVQKIVLRTNFSSSRLVRLLGYAAVLDVDTSRQDVAERLGQWVGAFESVTLHAAHQSITAVAEDAPSATLATTHAALDAHLQQVRGVLAHGITAKPAPEDLGKRARHPLNQPEPVLETGADFAPYRKRYLDQQRNMDLMVPPLRDHVRQTLSQASPALRQLAALDAVWEQMLAGRAQKGLSAVPGFLEKRFKNLRTTHQHDDPTLWRQPGGWLDLFGKELQDILLAELNVRLEPVVGLVEALSHKVTTHP